MNSLLLEPRDTPVKMKRGELYMQERMSESATLSWTDTIRASRLNILT